MLKKLFFPERVTRSGFWWSFFWLAPVGAVTGALLADFLHDRYGTGALLLYFLCGTPFVILAAIFAAARANDIRLKGGDDGLAHIGFALPLALTFGVAVLDEMPSGLQPKLLGQPAVLDLTLVAWFLSLGFCVVSFFYLLFVGPRNARAAPVDVHAQRHPFFGTPAAIFGLMFFFYAFAACVGHYKGPGLLAAAEKGDIAAQVGAAEMYRKGIGVKRNYDTYFKWASRAAASGNWSALYYLAEAHDEGLGTHQDSEKATTLYRKAAVQGWEPAQFAMGERYALGKGVKRDYVQAYKWYSTAAIGDRRQDATHKAAEAREDLIKLMTPAQIKQAERISPKPKKPPAPPKNKKT